MFDEKLILLSKPQIPSSLDVEHRWNTYGTYTISDGLLSNIDDTGTLADSDMIQATVVNQPQFGYDHVALFDVSGLVDGLTTSFPNTASSTTRNLATLTEAGATAPTKASGYLEFAIDKRLTLSNVAKTLSTITIESFCKVIGFSGSVVNGTEIRLHNQSTSTANYGAYLSVIKIAADEYRIRFFVGNGTSSVTLSSPTYTEAQITALLANDTHIVGRFLTGSFSILVDNVIVASTTSTTVITCSIQAVSDLYIRNQMTGTTLYLKYNRTYFSHLTNNEVGLLYTNKVTPTYQIPKSGLVSDGSNFIRAFLLQNTPITNFTSGVWVYLQKLSDVSAGTTDQHFIGDLFAGTGNKGFHLKIQKNASDQFYFRLAYGNGTITTGMNTPLMTRSAFASSYVDKYIFVSVSLKNKGANDLVTIYVNGQNVVQMTAVAGRFITSDDGYVNLMRIQTFVSTILAGNKMLDSFVHFNRAYNATEMRRRYLADIAEHPEYSN